MPAKKKRDAEKPVPLASDEPPAAAPPAVLPPPPAVVLPLVAATPDSVILLQEQGRLLLVLSRSVQDLLDRQRAVADEIRGHTLSLAEIRAVTQRTAEAVAAQV